MLLVTFTKNWWKSLTKSDDNQEKEISELTNTEFMTDKEKTADDLLATEEPEIEKELFVPPDINEQLDVKLSSDVDEQDLDADDEDSEEEDSFTHQGAEREFETEEELAAPYSLDDDEDNFDEDEEGMGNEERDYPRRRRVRTNIYTAKDFFNEEIHYRFDILDDDERKELEGTYRLELKGYQGGVWSVKVGENIEIVNRREDTEIVINMQHRDFLSLANGQLNPQLAIFAQKMKIVGDLKKAINFQLLISPTSR